jgi:hypothetical protein
MNNFPYNAIFNEKLNNSDESIASILEASKMFFNTSTSTGQFTLSNSEEHCLQNFIDYFHKFDTKHKDFLSIINNQKVHNAINNNIKNKQDFEMLFVRLQKDNKNINQQIKCKYLYIKVHWKPIRRCGFFKSHKVILTISNQTKGKLVV